MSREFDIEKLKGNANYHAWSFAIQNLMAYKGFSKCITDPVTEKDANKLANGKALLALSIDSHIYVHINNC